MYSHVKPVHLKSFNQVIKELHEMSETQTPIEMQLLYDISMMVAEVRKRQSIKTMKLSYEIIESIL